MKAVVVYFAVICMFVHTARAQDDTSTSVDCTKPPRHVPLHICCPVPHLNSDDLMQQCSQYARGPPPPSSMRMSNNMPPPPPPGPRGGPKMHGHHPPHRHGPPPCLMECIFNQTGIADENGELNEDKFKEVLHTIATDNEEMISVMEESLDTCLEKATDLKAEIAEKMKEHPDFSEKMRNKADFHSCSPFSAMMMGCITFETFQNCPTSSWNDSEECNEIRKFSEACEGPKLK